MDDRKDTEEMTLDRFAQIVEAYGGSPRRWPEGERDEAEQLMERSAEARAIVERCAGLDALLDEAPGLEPSRALRDRILAAAPAARRSWAETLNEWASNLWPLGRSWQPIGALAAAAALGIAAGLVVPNTLNDAEEADAYEMSDLSLGEVAEPAEVP
jgi:hypothetical protein